MWWNPTTSLGIPKSSPSRRCIRPKNTKWSTTSVWSTWPHSWHKLYGYSRWTPEDVQLVNNIFPSPTHVNAHAMMLNTHSSPSYPLHVTRTHWSFLSNRSRALRPPEPSTCPACEIRIFWNTTLTSFQNQQKCLRVDFLYLKSKQIHSNGKGRRFLLNTSFDEYLTKTVGTGTYYYY